MKKFGYEISWPVGDWLKADAFFIILPKFDMGSPLIESI